MKTLPLENAGAGLLVGGNPLLRMMDALSLLSSGIKSGICVELAEDTHLHDKYTDPNSPIPAGLQSCSALWRVVPIRNPTKTPQIPHGM